MVSTNDVTNNQQENSNIGIKGQSKIRLKALKALKKSHRKGSKNRQALERGRVDSDVGTIKIPYSELDKIRLTPLADIKKSAKKIYNLFKAKSKDKDRKDLGVPRPIFTSLVNQIVYEETNNLLLSSSNLKKKADGDDDDKNILMRPKSAPLIKLRDSAQQSRNMLDDKENYNDDNDDDNNDDNDIIPIRPKSAIDGISAAKARRRILSVLDDVNIMKVRERKFNIEKERERQIIRNINKKFHLDLEANEHLKRQKSWISIILALRYMPPMFTMIKARRYHLIMTIKFRKEAKSVSIIQRWWSNIKIRTKFKRDMKLLFFLRFFVIRANTILKLRDRRKAVLLIRQFVSDASSGAKRVIAIYNFRKNCMTVQRWFRSWFEVKKARLQSLWKAMERIMKRRHEESIKQARINEINALKAISAMEGFDKTLNQLNVMNKKIDQLVQKEQRIMKSVIRSQQKEDKNLSELIGAAKDTFKKVEEVPIKEKRAKSGKGWYQCKMEDPDAAVKMKILSDCLKQQRRRHIRKEEQELRRSKKIKVIYDLNEVKEFLLSDTVGVPVAQKVEGTKRIPFLLLTQGGIDSLDGISNYNVYPIPKPNSNVTK